ncbi:aminotransferase class IV [Pararhodobacter aggregans]
MPTDAATAPRAEACGPVWIDGSLRAAADARLPLLTHSLFHGDAVFEGIRAYDGRLFLGREHFRRLGRSAQRLGYTLPWRVEDLLAAAAAVLWAGGLADAYLRPVAWRGEEGVSQTGRGCRVHTAIAACHLPPQVEGLRLVLSDWRRPGPDMAPTQAKCAGLDLTASRSRATALRSGHDDALMLDGGGRVAGTTAANIVLVRGGTLHSPEPVSFLDSLTKRHVFALARTLGLPVREGPVTLADLKSAEEVFVTGTLVELCPVLSLDRPGGHYIWPKGPVTAALRRAFEASTRVQA